MVISTITTSLGICADAGYPRLGPLGTEGRGYAAGYELDSEVTERER